MSFDLWLRATAASILLVSSAGTAAAQVTTAEAVTAEKQDSLAYDQNADTGAHLDEIVVTGRLGNAAQRKVEASYSITTQHGRDAGWELDQPTAGQNDDDAHHRRRGLDCDRRQRTRRCAEERRLKSFQPFNDCFHSNPAAILGWSCSGSAAVPMMLRPNSTRPKPSNTVASPNRCMRFAAKTLAAGNSRVLTIGEAAPPPVSPMTSPRVVLATVGALGDLHPFRERWGENGAQRKTVASSATAVTQSAITARLDRL
ncbi:hypothetical protein [Sphingomonas guangdongensis]|uniref:hypothetical protein n=1 Tax=Sphingomonas guangdongensis TaxID=1141890 RepID=UPI000BE4221E|nr:hypothetical protein [Sphingomonas guangdongensis]